MPMNDAALQRYTEAACEADFTRLFLMDLLVRMSSTIWRRKVGVVSVSGGVASEAGSGQACEQSHSVSRSTRLFMREDGGWLFHDKSFVPCHLPGKDERLVPIALVLRSREGIQDVHGTAGDLYHHDSMGRWRMAEQMTLHTDNRVVTAS
jgi:hypothetical protein